MPIALDNLTIDIDTKLSVAKGAITKTFVVTGILETSKIVELKPTDGSTEILTLFIDKDNNVYILNDNRHSPKERMKMREYVQLGTI